MDQSVFDNPASRRSRYVIASFPDPSIGTLDDNFTHVTGPTGTYATYSAATYDDFDVIRPELPRNKTVSRDSGHWSYSQC